jgi:hypothetical protein
MPRRAINLMEASIPGGGLSEGEQCIAPRHVRRPTAWLRMQLRRTGLRGEFPANRENNRDVFDFRA